MAALLSSWFTRRPSLSSACSCIRADCEALQTAENHDRKQNLNENINKWLQSIASAVNVPNSTSPHCHVSVPPTSEGAGKEGCVRTLCEANFFKSLFLVFRRLSLRNRTLVTGIFVALLKVASGPEGDVSTERDPPSASQGLAASPPHRPVLQYLCSCPEIMDSVVRGYEVPPVSVSSGIILRECAKYAGYGGGGEALTRLLIYDGLLYRLIYYSRQPMFDVASDAFLSLRSFLTTNKALSCEYILDCFDDFFRSYQQLLTSTEYVNRRQGLKLLSELLLDPAFMRVMIKYVKNPDNLELCIDCMKEDSRAISYESFHVFKIFVVNPRQPRRIRDLLCRHRDSLIQLLSYFQEDRREDESFLLDKKSVLLKLQMLPSTEDTTLRRSL